jgi:hypothetical protein
MDGTVLLFSGGAEQQGPACRSGTIETLQTEACDDMQKGKPQE